jgi:Cu/Ag efflux protein CusF
MDESLKLTLPQRWGFSFGLSLVLWVTPIAFKAPKMAIFLSLMGATAGFGSCIALTEEWRNTDRFSKKMRIHREELQNFQLAMEEESTKRSLADLIFGSVGSDNSEPAPEFGSFPSSESLPGNNDNSPVGSGSGSVPAPNPVNQLYTPQKISFDAAIALISQMAQSMTQTQIIEGLWQVKKGSSKAYKAAMAEFKLLTQ